MKQTILTVVIAVFSIVITHAQNTDYKNFLKNKTGITVNIGDTDLYLDLQYDRTKGLQIAKKGDSLSSYAKKYKKTETHIDSFLSKEFPDKKDQQILVKQLILSELDLKAQKKEYELKLKNEKNKGKDRIAVIKPDAFQVTVYTNEKRKGVKKRNIKKALGNKDSTGYLKIDSVQIAFSDGFIKDMTAIGTLNEKTVIFKNPSPIPVRYYRDIERINKDSWYALVCRDDSEINLIKLNDIITYLPNYSSRCQSFYPNNSIISFDGESKAETIYQRPFMENFDIRLYTDIMGFNQGKPNGLVQAEGKAGFILLSDRPFRRTFSGSSNYNRIIFLTLHKIRLYTKYSQIGEGDKVLPLKNSFKFDGYAGGDTVRCATNFDLFRYSNLDIGFELDLFTILSQSIKFDIKLNAGVFATKIDSVYDQIGCEISYKAPTNKNVFSYYLNPEVSFRFYDSNYLDFNMRFGSIHSNLFKNTDNVRQYVEDKQELSNSDPDFWEFITQTYSDPLWKFQVNLGYHPAKKSEKSVFGRFTGYINNGHFHPQLELGYSAPVSEFFSSKKK